MNFLSKKIYTLTLLIWLGAVIALSVFSVISTPRNSIFFGVTLLGLLGVGAARFLLVPFANLILQANDLLDLQPPRGFSDLQKSITKIKNALVLKTETLNLERQQQATLMGAISDAILAVDLQGAPLFYNSRFEVLFGRENLKAGVRLWEIIRDPEMLSAFKSSTREGRSASVKAVPIEVGERRLYFSMTASPLKKPDESTYGAIGIFHDVTDLKNAEQMRIDFVANVSHELRTPLTSIKGYVDTLREDVSTGRAVEPQFLEAITRNTDRLVSLIQDLLDLSSLESTEIPQKQNLDTEQLTRRILSQVQGALDRKSQIVDLSFKAETVYADSRRVEQVLVNLLDNANKYSPSNGRILVSWEKSSRNSILLRIQDSGPGIPMQHHLRLFERFYRVDPGRSRDHGGTGLGLAIVKHIMQRHEGTVWVESGAGVGTAFICEFP